jgi:hypothetical protein
MGMTAKEYRRLLDDHIEWPDDYDEDSHEALVN